MHQKMKAQWIEKMGKASLQVQQMIDQSQRAQAQEIVIKEVRRQGTTRGITYRPLICHTSFMNEEIFRAGHSIVRPYFTIIVNYHNHCLALPS